MIYKKAKSPPPPRKWVRWLSMVAVCALLVGAAMVGGGGVSAATPHGWLDDVNSTIIRGWAWDSAQPNTAIPVHIYIYRYENGALVEPEVYATAVTANLYREDLAPNGIGNGYHAFSLAMDWSQFPAGTYIVTAWGIGSPNVTLQGSGKLYTKSGLNIPEGTYHIRNVNSGKYLDSYNNGVQWDYDGSYGQYWTLINYGNGYYKVRDNNNRYLDVANIGDSNGTNVGYSMDGISYPDAKTFLFIPTGTYNGQTKYRIKPKCSNTRVLDVSNATGTNLANGCNVQLWTWSNVPQQEWVLELAKDVYTNSDSTANSNYNRGNAANWAYSYATYYRNGYSKDDTPGYAWAVSNCVNFASASMLKGGLAEKKGGLVSYTNWYYDTKLLGSSRNDSSGSWLLSEEFAKHWGHNMAGVGMQRAYRTMLYPSMQNALVDWNYVYSNMYRGDIIQFTESATGLAFHTGIVVERAGVETLLYSQHSAEQVDYTTYNMQIRLNWLLNDGRDYGIILHRIKL